MGQLTEDAYRKLIELRNQKKLAEDEYDQALESYHDSLSDQDKVKVIKAYDAKRNAYESELAMFHDIFEP